MFASSPSLITYMYDRLSTGLGIHHQLCCSCSLGLALDGRELECAPSPLACHCPAHPDALTEDCRRRTLLQRLASWVSESGHLVAASSIDQTRHALRVQALLQRSLLPTHTHQESGNVPLNQSPASSSYSCDHSVDYSTATTPAIAWGVSTALIAFSPLFQ